jgi:hypothetical protein
MSYSSRVYRQRNAHTHDDAPKDAFFGKQHDRDKQADNKPFFQTKLSVNEPGDKYEKEADTVANDVVNKSSPKKVAQRKKISNVQRLSTSSEDEKLGTNDARMARDKEIQEKPLQRATPDKEKEKMKSGQKKDKDMPDKEKEKMKGVQKKGDSMEEEEKKVQKMDDPKEEENKKKKKPAQVQKKGEGTSTYPSSKLSSKIEEGSGKGKTLPSKTLHEMNSSFDADFSNVQIHDDSEAASLSSELDAQAFTHGKDIYFNEGRFNPENAQGKLLLAHELTHVVQQSDHMPANPKEKPGQAKASQVTGNEKEEEKDEGEGKSNN